MADDALKLPLKVVDGVIIHPWVKVDICPRIDQGPLKEIHAIVMHQTGGSTAAGTLAEYKNPNGKRVGAHFLLDKDGTLYQTMAITHQCWHVAPIRSRCLAELSCSKEDLAAYTDLLKASKAGGLPFDKALGRYEGKKNYPDRYPYNPDAIGIEVVGRALGAIGHEIYENPTQAQADRVHWFVGALLGVLKLKLSDVYRHPMLQKKNATEAAGVVW